MPTFLSDPPQVLYLVIGGLLVITGVIAAQKQNRLAIVPFAVAFFLMLLVFLIDWFAESPREEATRRATLMAVAAETKHPDRFVEHVADKVTIHTATGEKTLTREELQKHAFWGQLRQLVSSVSVKGFSRDDAKEIDGNSIEIGFVGHVTVQGGQSIPVYVRAAFTRQPDGLCKLTVVRFFEPVDRSKLLLIPGFP